MMYLYCSTLLLLFLFFFFFNDTATTEIYTLSLHDALPISAHDQPDLSARLRFAALDPGERGLDRLRQGERGPVRSEEHTSELQSLAYLVCRLLLEKKKKEIHTSKRMRM